MAIIPALSWRIKSPCFDSLPVKIIMYQVAQHYGINPGAMCVYVGPTTPVNLNQGSEEAASESGGYIEINSRDFMAALQRLLVVKFEKFQANGTSNNISGQQQFNPSDSKYSPNRSTTTPGPRGSPIVEKLAEECRRFYICTRLYLSRIADQEFFTEYHTPARISPDVINMLTKLAGDPNSQVREMAIYNIGVIGTPESLEILDPLEKALYDADPLVRAMSCWALGVLGPQIG
jgi:hypothetical protein